jgi:hypothetical protein
VEEEEEEEVQLMRWTPMIGRALEVLVLWVHVFAQAVAVV